MEFKTIDEKSYNIHTIKVNRYKTSRIEVIFRTPVIKEDIAKRAFISELLCEGCKKYPTRRDIVIKLEDIYKPMYNCITTKTGNCLNTIFSLTFINPEYINDKNYLKDIITFLFDMILKPNASNNEFNSDNFNLVKKNILLDIDSINENPEKKAINNALKNMDNNSSSSYPILGTKEEVEDFSKEDLYNVYINMLNKANVDIFVIGNTNLDNITSLIKKSYHNHLIRDNKIDYYIENKLVKKSKNICEDANFLQTQLVYISNLANLTKIEKEVTFHILNYILGSGGLSSKLYKYIREENSYCYQISSMYFKYDNLLCISSSLEKKNINDTIKLIRKSIKEMKDGLFTDEQINDAKQNMLLSLKINRNNPSAILANYEFKVFLDNYLIEEKINAIKNITKKDIIALANKIKENTIYVLNEEDNERN